MTDNQRSTMRIVIERRTELADQGTTERRIEVEMDDRDVPETVLLVQKLVATLDEPCEEVR